MRNTPAGRIMLNVLLVLGTVFFPAATSSIATESVSPDCGTRSLYLMLKLCDRPITLDSLDRHLPDQPPAGYSMLDLQEAARSFALRLDGVQVGRGGFDLDRPAIAHLANGEEGGHYVVLKPTDPPGHFIQVLAPPYPPKVVLAESLYQSAPWTGRLLLPRTRHDDASTMLASPITWGLVALALLLVMMRRRIHPRSRRFWSRPSTPPA